MLKTAAAAADEALAIDVVGLDVGGLTPYADHFMIATVDNPRHMRATLNAIDKAMDAKGFERFGVEGGADADWTLVNYGDLVVHLFLPEAREFYALEKLWADAPSIRFEPAKRSVI